MLFCPHLFFFLAVLARTKFNKLTKGLSLYFQAWVFVFTHTLESGLLTGSKSFRTGPEVSAGRSESGCDGRFVLGLMDLDLYSKNSCMDKIFHKRLDEVLIT